MEDSSVSYGFKNIFITMFATFFFFKLLIKVFLALPNPFLYRQGNRKEAARILKRSLVKFQVKIHEFVRYFKRNLDNSYE